MATTIDFSNSDKNLLAQAIQKWQLGAEKFNETMEKIKDSEVMQGIRAENAKFKQNMSEVSAKRKGNIDVLEQIRSLMSDEANEEQQSKLMDWLFGPKDKYRKELKQYKEYLQKRKQIQNEYKDDPESQELALLLLDELTGQKIGKIFSSSSSGSNKSSKGDDGVVGELVKTASDELSDGLGKLLTTLVTDFDNFGENFNEIGVKMLNSLLSKSANMLIEQLINKENTDAAVGTIKSAWEWMQGVFKSLMSSINNIFNSIGGKIGNIFSGIAGGGESGFIKPKSWWRKFTEDVLHIGVKFHSGGVVPLSSEGYELPGTKEQLAILKGGERVLSPSENVSYSNNQGSQPIIFNNFNVKAWDSKDVQKYLLENKNLLNAITFEGIKDNNQRLRQMVRNA